MPDDDKGQSDKDLDRTEDTDDDADDVYDTDDDADDDKGDKSKSDKDKDKSTKDADRIAELEAQLEKRSKSVKMARADRERLEKELKQLRDKDLPEIDKLKTELAEANKALEESRASQRQQRIDLAFLRDNTHQWRNPATALKLADLSKVDVDDDTGEVTGLKAALDALAKSDPYLIADSKSDKDDDKDDDDKPKGSTGSPNNRNRSGGTDKKKLVSRFPSMRTRGVSS